MTENGEISEAVLAQAEEELSRYMVGMMRNCLEVGRVLQQIKVGLYICRANTWRAYCEARLPFGYKQAERYIKAYDASQRVKGCLSEEDFRKIPVSLELYLKFAEVGDERHRMKATVEQAVQGEILHDRKQLQQLVEKEQANKQATAEGRDRRRGMTQGNALASIKSKIEAPDSPLPQPAKATQPISHFQIADEQRKEWNQEVENYCRAHMDLIPSLPTGMLMTNDIRRQWRVDLKGVCDTLRATLKRQRVCPKCQGDPVHCLVCEGVRFVTYTTYISHGGRDD